MAAGSVVTLLDRWIPVAITPHATATNLWVNDRPYPHIANSGSGGTATITWEDATSVAIYIGQGQVISAGRWKGLTAVGAGVTILGLKE